MRLKKIEIQNIRSYENAELEFPEGKVLLSGDIGSGKSSILLAVEFALFGLQRGVGGSSLLRNGSSKGKVRLNFDVDGKDVVVERILKRGKDSITQDSCSIESDGRKEDISNIELKSKILSMLNYPQEFLTKNPILYRYTVYTPQEEMKAILIEDVETRLNTLRRVFGIDRYKRIISNSENFAISLRERIREKDGKVYDLEDKKHELFNKSEESKKIKVDIVSTKLMLDDVRKVLGERNEMVKEIEDKSRELSKLKIDFSGISSELKMKKEQKEISAREISELIKKIEDIEKKLSEKNFDISVAEKISSELLRKESELKEHDKQYLEVNKMIYANEMNKSRMKKITDDIFILTNCPTCMQNVNPDHKGHIKQKNDNEISAIEAEIKKLSERKMDIEKNRERISLEMQKLRQDDRDMISLKIEFKGLEEKKLNKKRFEENSKIIEDRIYILESQKFELEKKISEFGDMDKRYLIARNMLDEAKNEEKRIEVMNGRIEKQLEENSLVTGKLKKEIETKEKIKSDGLHLKKLENWISVNFISTIEKIEKEVMSKVHSEFSELFGKWFSMLVDGLSARINEEFTPTIEQNGFEIDYKFLSGGERTAAALAYRLALNQVINGLMSEIKTRDLLILDEPTDGFSQEQIDKLRNVFDELKIAQLILVSHEQKIESFVEKVIRLRKEGATSVS
ncbi:MAG: AAA family ATPase [Nanoarchaeota archaeon]|nr:AAA family ATPase [Nanoarchaeota archaeon]